MVRLVSHSTNSQQGDVIWFESLTISSRIGRLPPNLFSGMPGIDWSHSQKLSMNVDYLK